MPRANSPPPPFPLYFLPNLALPFRRRRSSAQSTSTSSTTSSSPPSLPTSYLASTPTSHLRCNRCLTDISPISSIISKGFTGRNGRAYLVSPPNSSSIHGGSVSNDRNGDEGMGAGDLPNVHTHKPDTRTLVTGVHTVSDISCKVCGSLLGWKYVDAEEDMQKYKVGKYILETTKVVRGSGWEGVEREEGGNAGLGLGMGAGAKDEVEFDSQDEEECEDLFSGIWSPQLAKRRRRMRGAAAPEGSDMEV